MIVNFAPTKKEGCYTVDKLRQDLNMGTNIRALRKQCHLTQEEVTAKLQILGQDINRSIYSRYETGELNIKISHLIALKNIFNCTYDDFFADLG